MLCLPEIPSSLMDSTITHYNSLSLFEKKAITAKRSQGWLRAAGWTDRSASSARARARRALGAGRGGCCAREAHWGASCCGAVRPGAAWPGVATKWEGGGRLLADPVSSLGSARAGPARLGAVGAGSCSQKKRVRLVHGMA
jgi:hypothetical protein